MTAPRPIDLSGELSRRATIHMNVRQAMLVITEDKLRLRLIEHRDCIADKNEWLTPLGILLVLVTTLVTTTDFHDFLKVKAAVWSAAYLLGSIVCAVWLAKAGLKAWRNRNLGSLDTLVGSIKRDIVASGPQETWTEFMQVLGAEIARQTSAPGATAETPKQKD